MGHPKRNLAQTHSGKVHFCVECRHITVCYSMLSITLSPSEFEQLVAGCQQIVKEGLAVLSNQEAKVALHTDSPSVKLILGASDLLLMYQLLSEAHIMWQFYLLTIDA
jgi:hypothetical protein